MDDHDGTGKPGENNGTAPAGQPAGQRRQGPRPAAKGRKAPARTTRKPASAPPQGGNQRAQDAPAQEVTGQEAATPAAAPAAGQATAAEATAPQPAQPAPEQSAPPAPEQGATDAARADAGAAAKNGPAAATADGSAPTQPAAAAKGPQASPAAPGKTAATRGKPTLPTQKAAATPPAKPAVAARKATPAKPAVAARKTTPAVPATPATPGTPAKPAVAARKTTPAVPAQKVPAQKAPVRGKAVAAKGAKPSVPRQKTPQKTPATAQVAGPQVTEPAAEQPAPPQGGPWQVPGYLYEGDLGARGSGRVVKARDEANGTPVAITYLSAALATDATFREAFRGEAEPLGGLNSSHVERFYAYAEDGANAAVVTELVDGVTLDTLLRETGATTPESALTVLKGSLLGLAAAHEVGVVHRAVRPANVAVTTDGTAKLAGFGLAPRGGEGTAPAADAPYTAPEVGTGGPATAAADLYAAAATFQDCLTGSTPHAAGTEAEPPVQQAETPIPGGRFPEPVRPLLASGLAEDPAERPKSAADFAAALEAVAVAAYGEDWEQRGRQELAALVGPLVQKAAEEAALVAPPAPAPQTSGPTPAGPAATAIAPAALARTAPPSVAFGGAGATPTGNGPAPGAEGPKPRFGRRAKILAVAVAGVIVVGAVAVTAMATGNNDDDATATPTPSASASLTSAPAPATTSPSAVATTPTGSTSPSAAPTVATPAATESTPAATATATQDVSATPTGTSAGKPTAVPTTPSAGPTKTTGSTAGPQVSSVAVTGFTCSAGSRTAKATVFVRYDGAAAGTLHLSWWRSATGTEQGAVRITPQTARFPKGATSYTFTSNFSFTADAKHPYVGVTVSTDPAAGSGNGSSRVGCN
ncbi:protein kinase domain-containing protein [Streptomyces sp. NBC_01190]|uniref:protein kinase domain-containing protein n=1 Tax=Streptomyces sp. NBC_01190 TaxID=2903767 RepID=UPI0038658154|nr:protein kinase [Streptomyces sp. NBC_01190]